MTEEAFKVGGARWFLRMVEFYPPAKVPLTAAGVAALLLAIAGLIWDLRLLIVALMVVMLVVPMLCALLFFNYGLLPVNSLNMTLHRLRAEGPDIIVEILGRETDPREEVAEGKEGAEDSGEELRILRSVRIPGSAVVSRKSAEIVVEADGHRQLLLVPEPQRN